METIRGAEKQQAMATFRTGARGQELTQVPGEHNSKCCLEQGAVEKCPEPAKRSQGLPREVSRREGGKPSLVSYKTETMVPTVAYHEVERDGASQFLL